MNNYGGIKQTLLYYLKELRRSPSSDVIEQILGMEEIFSILLDVYEHSSGISVSDDYAISSDVIEQIKDAILFKGIKSPSSDVIEQLWWYKANIAILFKGIKEITFYAWRNFLNSPRCL